LAKVAWQREAGPDGLVYPGKFVQVELMVKDARLYKRSDGWGWGRWRGQDLKPYGKDARFVNECTGCHQPVKGNDYVYTLPISGAILRGQEVVNNNAAALPVDLPYLPETPTKWGAITTFVDPAARTTATLYGGGIALTAVDARIVFSGGNPSAQSYPLDAVLALVTWKQRDDPHWFGGRIPDLPLSVEFVQVAAPGQVSQYRRFAGPRLDEDLSTAGIAKQRTDFILGLRPAPLP
jgi:hypothetical protein